MIATYDIILPCGLYEDEIASIFGVGMVPACCTVGEKANMAIQSADTP